MGRLKSFPGVDSWREQYFENQPVPDNVVIPIDDAAAWQLYPHHRWVYNKLLICESQGLQHGPHGTLPPRYPVFSKPIYNIRGMGTGGHVVHDKAEYLAAIQPGYLWMTLFTGRHVSTDVALARGVPRWWRHTEGVPGQLEGTFDYWTVRAATDPVLEGYLGNWVGNHLKGFTGIVNLETIGGRILECHLRMAEQWQDLNGPGWLAAVVRLYDEGVWQFSAPPREGYSVVLFGAHQIHWSVDRSAVKRLLGRPDVSSIQITFEDEIAPARYAMPPGGFRLAIINCWDLVAGRALREELKGVFVGHDGGSGAKPFG